MRDYKTIDAVSLSHVLMQPFIDRTSVAVDATAGNGLDTLFLAPLVAHVYSFDIQPEALNKARQTLVGYDNVTFINDSHANMARYDIGQADLIIFNLGWLPGGRKAITTETSSTLAAIKQAWTLLKPHGGLVVTFYPGHENGLAELKDGLVWFDSLAGQALIVSYQTYRQPAAPAVFSIEKR